MATIKTDLICNLNQPVNVTYLHGNLFSQDNAGNTINVFVMDNGEPATIGGTVSANVIRSDGQTVAVSGAIEGNKAYVILPQACYAVPGVVHIIIKLTQNTTITTIAAIVANVYMSTTDAVIDPGTVIPSIQALMALIEEAVDSIPTDYTGLLHTIAADYSSSKTYKVGDYAWESGVLKRCIVPITAAETYTAAHWTNAVIGDDLTNLKSAIDNTHPVATVKTSSSDVSRITYWIDSTGVIKTSNSSIILPVIPGSTYSLTTTFNDGTNYALLEDTVFVVNSAPNYATGYTGRVMVAKNAVAEFTAPSDARYIIIRADTDNMQNAITFKQYADLQSIDRFNTCIEKQTSARNYEFFSIVPYVGMQAGSTNKIVSNTSMYLAYVECEENRTYTVSKTADARFAVAWVKENPSVGTDIYNYVSNDTASSLQITTGDGAKYVCVYYFANGISTLTENALFLSLSIVDQGYTAIDRKARQENNLASVKCVENGEFVLNKDNMLVGAGLALDPSTRKFITNAVMYTAYIPCEQNQLYIVEKIADTRFAVAWSKATPAVGVDIFGYYADPTGTEISIYTGDDAKYLCIYYFASGVSTHTESELFASLSVTLDGYSAVDRVARQAKNATTEGVYIVAKDGKYKTINSALLVASAGDTILIMPGTYEEQIDTKNKNIHLVGYNKETCIILDKTGMYNTPPIEISGGSIQNLTIIETGEQSTPSDPGTLPTLAYCIHADWDAMTDNSLLISNCILKCNKRATIGVGARNGFQLTVENCDLWSGVQEDTGHDPRGAFYIHTYQYDTNTTGTKLIMRNNRITCEDSVAICLQDEGGVHVSCDLENNNLYSAVGGVNDNIVKGGNNQTVSFSTTLIKEERCYGNNISIINA